MTEALALALLTGARGIGFSKRERLIEAAGSAQNALEDPGAFAPLLTADELHALRDAVRGMDSLCRTLERERVTLVARGEAGYPPLLAQIARPPRVLFVQGEANLADACPFSIVGTRQASEYGLRHAREIARGLAAAGVCVVSGLALGIDGAAHLGALDAGGRTVAVLGGALDQFYPADNRPLRERILKEGGSIVSEFPMGMRPTRYSFLQRNRVIAGMSLGVLVAEAPLHSGALRTARDALDENRELFALPGSVDSALSKLPNQLIAEGARVATCARDILDAMVIDAPKREQKTPKADRPSTPEDAQVRPSGEEDAPMKRPLPPGLGEDELSVLRALDAGEMDFDALCAATGIAADDLGALLTLMELDGHVIALAGLRYARA